MAHGGRWGRLLRPRRGAGAALLGEPAGLARRRGREKRGGQQRQQHVLLMHLPGRGRGHRRSAEIRGDPRRSAEIRGDPRRSAPPPPPPPAGLLCGEGASARGRERGGRPMDPGVREGCSTACERARRVGGRELRNGSGHCPEGQGEEAEVCARCGELARRVVSGGVGRGACGLLSCAPRRRCEAGVREGGARGGGEAAAWKEKRKKPRPHAVAASKKARRDGYASSSAHGGSSAASVPAGHKFRTVGNRQLWAGRRRAAEATAGF